jgi:hypothetical protein
MKKIIFALVLISTCASFAVGKLASIDCLANNGVTITTEKQVGSSVHVNSQWGLFTKNFTARIAETNLQETVINLLNNQGEKLYMISLNMNPLTLRKQKAEGFILVPSSHYNGNPTALTGVQCDIKADLTEAYN